MIFRFTVSVDGSSPVTFLSQHCSIPFLSSPMIQKTIQLPRAVHKDWWSPPFPSPAKSVERPRRAKQRCTPLASRTSCWSCLEKWGVGRNVIHLIVTWIYIHGGKKNHGWKSWFSLSSIIYQNQFVMVLSMGLHHLSYFFEKERFTTIYLYFICSLRENSTGNIIFSHQQRRDKSTMTIPDYPGDSGDSGYSTKKLT